MFESIDFSANFTDFSFYKIDMKLYILDKMDDFFTFSESTYKIDLLSTEDSLETKSCFHGTVDGEPLKSLNVETFNCCAKS